MPPLLTGTLRRTEVESADAELSTFRGRVLLTVSDDIAALLRDSAQGCRKLSEDRE